MTKDMLSQSEIDSLLSGENLQANENYDEEIITSIEKDTIGEIGNIGMGTAATTLSTLLNKKVLITAPNVDVTSADELSYEYEIPFVAVDVTYKEGLEGSNVLMMNIDDVKIITDLMMGKEKIDTSRELSDLDLSAISEAMNQMMGSAATSLSEIFMKKIDIDPPRSYEITVSEGRETLDVLKTNGPIIRVSFKIEVEGLIDSEFMQLLPLEFGQEMAENLLGGSSYSETDTVEETLETNKDGNILDRSEEIVYEEPRAEKRPKQVKTRENIVEKEPVVVKKPSFETFDTLEEISYNESIDLVGDIPVEITVELGRTTKKIGEILEYGPGTVLELDKLVGEPLNLYANGKYIAKGEVVVIDDNFGIRITEIDNTYGK